MPGPCRPGVRPGRTSAQLRLGMHGHGLTHVLRELPAVGREGVAEAWVGDIHVPEPGERLGAGSGAAPAGADPGVQASGDRLHLVAADVEVLRGDIRVVGHDAVQLLPEGLLDRKSTRLNSSHVAISYA